MEVDSRRKEMVDQIKIASTEWGIFQVTNHGIPLNVLDEMIDGVRMFNEQDLELKKEMYSRDTTKPVRFDSNTDLYTSKTADWRDTLFLLPSVLILTPAKSQQCAEYVKHNRRLGETLFELLSEALGLRSDHLGSMGCGKGCSIVCHYYPPCPQPELTLGKKHTDPGFLNVLLQNEINGLQALHKGQCSINELTSEADPPRYKDVLKEYYARFLSNSDGFRLTLNIIMKDWKKDLGIRLTNQRKGMWEYCNQGYEGILTLVWDEYMKRLKGCDAVHEGAERDLLTVSLLDPVLPDPLFLERP
ncbi:1-aminocyclopropane-1-carboxylate oxidase-like protein 6 [Hibiscus syriacus]|uniref:1-aminocyclopropane-1-carboxylate oxidase-like protein 6 n=1 Tax=Hibiscus syriacus TaxID=106335 RepID=A0A6A2ZT39_HIBSY|nr:1-aminocyclopropane-1-carboxylate oxidase-like protein 6 [Hibiscus syriacus]